MIVPKEERDTVLQSLNYRPKLEKFLIELSPPEEFKDFFQTPYYIFHYDDCEELKDRKLLPLFEHVERVYAFDLVQNEYISFDLESPDSLTIYKNIYSVFLYLFSLHAWEYGGEEQEAREVIEFSDSIDFPYWETLRDIMNEVDDEGEFDRLTAKLESESDNSK